MKLLCPGHTQQLLAPSNCLGKKTTFRMQHAHPDCLPSVLGKHFSFDDEEVPNSYRLRTFLFWKLSEKKTCIFSPICSSGNPIFEYHWTDGPFAKSGNNLLCSKDEIWHGFGLWIPGLAQANRYGQKNEINWLRRSGSASTTGTGIGQSPRHVGLEWECYDPPPPSKKKKNQHWNAATERQSRS